MLYFDHGLGKSFTSYDDYFHLGVDEDAIVFLSLANKAIHQIRENAITIAEDMSGLPGIALPIKDGGVGFDFRLAMGVPDYWIKLIKDLKDEDWKMDNIFYELTNRRYGEKVISYCESHDQALVGDKTILYRLIDKDIYSHMTSDHRTLVVDRGIALHKMIRLLTMATAGGGYLNFMGNEFGHPEWIDFPRVGNNWSYHYARRQWSLRDDPKLCYHFLSNFDQEMVKLLKKSDAKLAKEINVVVIHNDDGLLGFRRGELLYFFNFNSTKSFSDYAVYVGKGEFFQIFNSDNFEFGGFERVPDGQKHVANEQGKISLYLPSRVVLVLKIS
jgi:1,4-alpha-glucan branching enzyme